MNINRHNYETFFLLYTDNELSVGEKKVVDEFVEANPDLQEELVMLQQSIFKADIVVFDDKNSLLKNELVPTGLQEKLLLHLDNELTSAEKNKMAGIIKADADIKKEWNILRETKLLPDTAIVFRDKQSLYRKEMGRLVAFPWRSVAAAAVFIGFGIWGGLVYLNKNTTERRVEIVKRDQTGSTDHTIKPDRSQTITPVAPSIENQKEAAVIRQVTDKKAAPASTIDSPKKIEGGRLTNEDIQPTAIIEKNNNLPKPYSDNLNKIGSNKTIPAYVTNKKQTNDMVVPGNHVIDENTGKQGPANIYAAATSFTDNSEDNNNNRVLFMDEQKIKKTKLGGIFRKVKRVLERNTNIKSGGNNIKVANLEFAIQ